MFLGLPGLGGALFWGNDVLKVESTWTSHWDLQNCEGISHGLNGAPPNAFVEAPALNMTVLRDGASEEINLGCHQVYLWCVSVLPQW